MKVTGGRIPGSSERLQDSKVVRGEVNLEVYKPLVYQLVINKWEEAKGDGILLFAQVQEGRIKQVEAPVEWVKEDNVIRVDCIEHLEFWIQVNLV